MIKPEHKYQKHYFHYLNVKLISMKIPLIAPNASYYNWTSVFEIPTGGWLKIDQNYITLCPICMISSPIFLPRPVGSHMVHALDTGFSRYVRQLESTHLNTRTAHHLTKHEEAHYVTWSILPCIRQLFVPCSQGISDSELLTLHIPIYISLE